MKSQRSSHRGSFTGHLLITATDQLNWGIDWNTSAIPNVYEH